MPNKMLIDASHAEETRVVVTRGNRVEEFDFESASRRQLRGNIYLAKVTRVEPSLQAAFIEYGGNRHGFLAFSEIHPDYYQIPVADRQALIEAEREVDRESEREDESRRRGGRRPRGAQRRRRSEGETVSASVEGIDGADEGAEAGELSAEPRVEAEPAGDEAGAAEAAGEPSPPEAEPELPMGPDEPTGDSTGGHSAEPAEAVAEPDPVSPESDAVEASAVEAREATDRDDEAQDGSEPSDTAEDEAEVSARAPGDEDDDEELEEHEIVEDIGGDNALEEARRPRAPRRHYKIQEVIKRRQILLVQVVKEERGNKGAALTTYLSLAGRYAVLMPNTGKGGGISRKITSAEDRKRLKEIVGELEVPDGMGIILRTAGASRTKPEIKRDFEYLMRLWESVRELTLSSSAPALVYEEGSLIKRAIRDLYGKEIDEVVVAGEEGYREAKDFMRMILPSHAKAVQPYREPEALFAKHGVEAQLDAMFSNHVTLKSGGYIVINPTEALVSIDVNSGRSTREHNIEDTALRTNLEAAEEIARQLRLRDLAGLIVIDFIDMDEGRNDRAVEKKLKDCLKNDRARIQVGRISPFGLLEMSRQRIRTGVLESSSIPCRHCAGTGFVRAVPSVALQILRSIEESLLRSATHNLVVRTRTEVAFYILNQKRSHLTAIEARFGVAVLISADETLAGTTTFAIDRGAPATPSERPAPTAGIKPDTIMPVDEPIEVDPTVELEREEEDEEERAVAGGADGGEEGAGGRRRRRRRRGGRGNGPREFNGSDRGERGDHEGATNGAGVGISPVAAAAGEDSLGVRDPDDFTEMGDAPVAAGSAGAPEIELPLPSVGLMIDAGERGQDTPRGLELGQYAKLDEEPSMPPAEREAAGAVEPAPPEPEPEPVAVVLTPPDPDRPKRGGWWSKAKSAIGAS